MHAERCVSVARSKLPFAECSVVQEHEFHNPWVRQTQGSCSLISQALYEASLGRCLAKIVWDDPPSAPPALRWTGRSKLVPRSPRKRAKEGTPGSKYAGGHRIRVTPVPIPNTEVKPDTADGTARGTVWESRSLPAVIARKRPDRASDRAFSRSTRTGPSCTQSVVNRDLPFNQTPRHPHARPGRRPNRPGRSPDARWFDNESPCPLISKH
jgi:hypothetical protein